MSRATAPGQLLWSLGVTAVAGAAFVVGLAGVWTPVVGGLAVGAGLALALVELATVSRLPPTAALLLGGVGPAVVIVVADGVADLSLPGLVGGAALGLVVAGATRYAEHVIVGEGPHRAGPALLARVVVPVRDLALALGGRPLREPPRLPVARTSRGR